MNRPIRRIAVAFMLLFLALLVNVNYVQVIQADDLNSRPDNRRVTLDEYAKQRGPITVGPDQIPVARSVRSKDPNDDLLYQRVYPQPELYGHLTGYYSYVYGRSQLEAAYNSILSGNDDRLFVRRMVDLLTNRKPRGGGVQLTIDPEAQKAAAEALGDKTGAVVALEPETGEVLAMVSSPAYDPNPLADHDLSVENRAWKKLNEDPANPAANRALQYRYPPGSTFKLVTAAAALETGDYTAKSVVPAPARLDLPLTTATLNNWQDGLCGDSAEITLTEAMQTSCNTPFGDLGMKLGQDALRKQAEAFGFNEDFDELFRDDLYGVRSQFPEEMDEPQTALSSIGQYDVQATPLQMAMVAAAIANGGEVMRPYVVDRLIGPDLQTLATTEPEVYNRAISPTTAEQLTEMMVATVNDGTAQSCKECTPYAWFVSFAPADDPQVAVAVVVEKADVNRNEISGGKLAAPIARSVMKAVIEQ